MPAAPEHVPRQADVGVARQMGQGIRQAVVLGGYQKFVHVNERHPPIRAPEVGCRVHIGQDLIVHLLSTGSGEYLLRPGHDLALITCHGPQDVCGPIRGPVVIADDYGCARVQMELRPFFDVIRFVLENHHDGQARTIGHCGGGRHPKFGHIGFKVEHHPSFRAAVPRWLQGRARLCHLGENTPQGKRWLAADMERCR